MEYIAKFHIFFVKFFVLNFNKKDLVSTLSILIFAISNLHIMSTKTPRPLYVIAKEIRQNWRLQKKGIDYGARPYLDAMDCLNTINDKYGCDSGKSIVCYFLANASTWRGPQAKEIKVELKKMVGLK